MVFGKQNTHFLAMGFKSDIQGPGDPGMGTGVVVGIVMSN